MQLSPELKTYKQIGVKNRTSFWEATIFKGEYLKSTSSCGAPVSVTVAEELAKQKPPTKAEILSQFRQHLANIPPQFQMELLGFNHINTIKGENTADLRARLEEQTPFLETFYNALDTLMAERDELERRQGSDDFEDDLECEESMNE